MGSIVSGFIAGAASLVGIALVMRWHKWTVKHSHFVNSLAAGTILGVAFFGLLPEAMALYKNAMLYVFIGFLALYIVENIMVFHSGAEIHFHGEHQHAHANASRAWTVFVGLFLHSLIDGFVIGVGFEASHSLGIAATMSVVIHELPEGATTFALLLGSIKRRSAMILSIAVGLATPLGAIISRFIFPGRSEAVLGAVLALAAGSFIYVGACDLVPETHTKKGWVNAFFLILGGGLAFLVSHYLHQHEVCTHH